MYSHLIFLAPIFLVVASLRNPISLKRGYVLQTRLTPYNSHHISHRDSHTAMFAKKSKKGNISSTKNDISDDFESADIDINSDEYFRAKLKAEIASPFFRLRQFLYVTMIAGGGLGTFTTIPQLILSMKNGGDVSTVTSNLAIDVGAAAIGAGLWLYDGKQQQKKVDRFTIKELRMSNKITNVEADDRSVRLQALPVDIQVSEFNETMTRIVPLGDLLLKGKQNAIIFAGKRSIVKDAVMSARIEGSNLFTKQETFLVPVVLEDDEEQLDLEDNKKGFGSKEGMLSAPYFGKPTQVSKLVIVICIML